MDENLCGLDNTNDVLENTEGKKVVPIEELQKKRKPFFFWEVNGTSHKMKLQTGMISKLENKYRRNLLNIISDDGIPPLSVMLTVVQAAIAPWEHGTTYKNVEELYDTWVEYNGGSQTELLSKVIIPTMAVSGFFTPEQADSIVNSVTEATDLI